MTTTNKRAALYARVSTKAQAEEDKASLPTQISDIEAYCQDKGYEIADRYVDDGYSGAKKTRPQFQRMLKDAEDGKFDVIVAWKSDRLSRGMYPAAALMEVIELRDIKLEAVKEAIDTNMFSMMAVVGKMELDNMKARFRMGKESCAKRGRFVGGYTPFGYGYIKGVEVPDSKKLVIYDEEADVIRQMFQSIADGMTMAAWARFANKQGLRTKRGGYWEREMVCKMLHDTRYIGQGYWGKSSGKKVPQPYPAIISKELFDEVQKKLTMNRKKSPCTSKHVYPLSKLGKCHCGAALGCTTNSFGRKYLYCHAQKDRPDIYQCYKPKHINMQVIEDHVWSQVEDILDNYRNGIYEVLLDQFEAAKQSSNDMITKAQEEIRQCQAEKQRLVTQVSKGVFTDEDIKMTMTGIHERMEHWQTEYINAQALVQDNDTLIHDFMEKLDEIDRLYNWGGIWFMTPEQKKQILNLMLKSFTLHPDSKIELQVKLPPTKEQIYQPMLSSVFTKEGHSIVRYSMIAFRDTKELPRLFPQPHFWG